MSNLNLGSLAAAAGVGALVTGLMKMTSAVAGFANDSVQMFAHFEQIENSLSGMLGSAEKGKEMFEDLRAFSFDTTFGVDTLAAATTQLLQTGTAADDVKKRLSQLGDIAGGDTNKFNDLVSIFAKIQNTGKATSMQMQQLALRGVPIYQVLKDIGVEGTATAEDITKAFEKMTEAGGMFYNNMQSINETISGKEGFVSDTFKEFLASFAEASGIASVYKAALDVVYNGLQTIVNVLQKINESPVLQAIFRGVLAATIAGIGTAILTNVIPAIASVISKVLLLNGQLSIAAALKAVVTGPAGWVALAAGIGVATGALIAMALEADPVSKKLKEITKQEEELRDKIKDNKGTVDVQHELKKLEIEEETIRLKQNELELQESIAKFGEGVIDSAHRDMLREEIGHERERIALLEQQAQKLQQQKALYDAMAKQASQMKSYVEVNNKNYESGLALAEDLYSKTVEGQLAALKQQQIMLQTAMMGELKQVMGPDGRMMNTLVGPGAEEMKKLKFAWEETMKRQEELKNPKSRSTGGGGGYRSEPELEEWRKILMQTTGLAKKDVVKGSGDEIIKKFSEMATDLRIKQASMGVSWEEVDKNLSDSFNKVWKAMQESGEFTMEDNSVKELIAQADALGIKLGENTKKLEDNTEELKKQMEDALKKADFASFGNAMMQANYKEGNVGGTIAGGAIGLAGQALNGSTAGNVVQGAAQGFAQGGIIGAIVGVIGALLDKLERWSEFLEEGEKTLEPLIDILSEFFSPLVDLAHMLTGITQVIGVVFKMLLKLSGISQILKIVGEVFSFIGDKITKFAEWLGKLFGIESEVSEARQTELEQLKALNEQYSNLFNAIIEEEEYYLQKRRELNGEYANEKAGLVNATNVNDMILTPQGNFSTDPNDYIIATKNPSMLGRSADASHVEVPKISIVVNNTIADTATVSVSNNTGDDGQQQLLVTISRKVANDFAEGINGWDSAIANNTARRRGRSIT